MVNGARARASRRIRGVHPYEPSLPAACCACRRTREFRASEPATELKRRADEHLENRLIGKLTCLVQVTPSPARAKCPPKWLARVLRLNFEVAGLPEPAPASH